MDSETLAEYVHRTVSSVKVIDVHTHLFPESHGDLLLYGVDDLLNYHYIVSEFFMVTGLQIQPEEFFSKFTKEERADMIWNELFINRSPISEACEGILYVMKELGLSSLVHRKDLKAIRNWFKSQHPRDYVQKVLDIAGVRYVVMTNIPFNEKETVHWYRETTFDESRFKGALRVDPLLTADIKQLERVVFKRNIRRFDDEVVLELLRWLEEWAKRIKAIYLFASTPQDFTYSPDNSDRNCERPSASFFIDQVLIPLARKLNIPIGLKLGAIRDMNPALSCCAGGDGVEIVNTTFIKCLCRKYPDVKFLVTFLSRVNQHEACVLANKFKNLHLYGCWWYCNNPSIIKEIVDMRLEMLGFGFTAQHSDARVLDQLIYKWGHSRKIIAKSLIKRYQALLDTGWNLKPSEIQRDIRLLLGESFEEFLKK